MNRLSTYFNKIKSFLESIIYDKVNVSSANVSSANELNIKENKSDEFKMERPFYILKLPVNLTQWKAVIPDSGESTLSWDEMNEFIKKLSRKLNVILRLPTSGEWKYARTLFPILKSQVLKAEITFWMYNRPYGTIIDERMRHVRIFELCEGADKLPCDIILASGNGHDAIALFLLTYDDCNIIKPNEILNVDDFYYVSC